MHPETSLSLAQFASAWRLLCATGPNYATATVASAECVFSGLPIPFFNVAIPMHEMASPADLEAAGREAVAWAAPHGVPWFFTVTEEALTPGIDAPAALDPVGLMPLLTLAGMIMPASPEPPKVPAGLTLDVPSDDAGCSALLTINAAAYGMDLDVPGSPLGTRAFWDDHVAVVGHAGGSPVSCSVVMPVDGHHYVAFVATHPDHQRKGYADAAMRHALNLAAQRFGPAPGFLHATDAGRPVYERMGYRAIATHRLYIEKRFMEGH